MKNTSPSNSRLIFFTKPLKYATILFFLVSTSGNNQLCDFFFFLHLVPTRSNLAIFFLAISSGNPIKGPWDRDSSSLCIYHRHQSLAGRSLLLRLAANGLWTDCTLMENRGRRAMQGMKKVGGIGSISEIGHPTWRHKSSSIHREFWTRQ